MSPSTLDDLAEAYSRVSLANKRTLDRFVQVGRLFHDGGIDFIVLKGADLLSRVYGVRGLRPITDVDLLVHERDLWKIDEILTASGFRRLIDGNPAYVSPEGGLILDITTAVWYADDQAGLWERAVRRTLDGLSIKCLEGYDLLLYLTAYSVVHRGYFVPSFMTDLRLLTRKERIDWQPLIAEATRHHLKIPVYHGLSFACRQEPRVFVPDGVLRRLAPSSAGERLLAWLLRRLVGTQPIEGLGHLLLFLTRPPGQKRLWLRRTFWPPPEFLASRYGDLAKSQPVMLRVTRALHLIHQAGLLIGRILARSIARSC
ncbi:MAG: nucleotidyltransferase family protein [Nitrospirota bacterium]